MFCEHPVSVPFIKKKILNEDYQKRKKILGSLIIVKKIHSGTSDEMISRSERTQHIKMSHSSIFIRIQNLPIVRSVGQQGWDVEHDLTPLELVVHTVESRAVIWNTVDHQKLYNHRLEECDSFYCGFKTISTVTSTFKNYPAETKPKLMTNNHHRQ